MTDAEPGRQPSSEKRRVPTDLSLEYGTADSPGYHTLASLMGKDGEYAIFRKFSSLNSLNLMRLQSELLELEQAYKNAVFKDEKNDKGVALASCFRALTQSDSKQKFLLQQIEDKLEAYNSALVKYNQVAALSSPKASSLEFVCRWLWGGKDGEGKGFIKNGNPVEVLTWSDTHKEDYIAIISAERDIWTSKMVSGILTVWNATGGRWRKPDKNLGVIQYSGLHKTTKLIVTILSSMVPALSILALFWVKDLLNRIWIMMGLTVAFAFMLTVFTDAKRIEVFSATAAFAAVEVVFIGSVDVSTGASEVAFTLNGTWGAMMNQTFSGILNGTLPGA